MEVEIIPYEPSYHQQFRQLNLEWLDRYGLTESHDLMILNNPQTYILDAGGYIWLARAGQEIVGSAALARTSETEFELAKMAVTASWQGKGISRQLMDVVLNRAREEGAERITLFSNHQLTRALDLYEKYGFRQVEVINSPFATADVKMELNL